MDYVIMVPPAYLTLMLCKTTVRCTGVPINKGRKENYVEYYLDIQIHFMLLLVYFLGLMPWGVCVCNG